MRSSSNTALVVYRQSWRTHTNFVIVSPYGSIQLALWVPGESEYPTFISYLWIDESCRRQGHASALLQKAEEIAASEGRECVWLCWDKADTPREILNWYIRRGYSEVSFNSQHVLLRKELQNAAHR